jgi:ABC-type multidrug transport system fused ATPase/permease subunit
MWLSLRLVKKWCIFSFFGLVFSCYCLAIGARHQATIRMAYLVVPFIIVMVVSNRKSLRARFAALTTLGLAVALSLILSLPLTLDFLSQMRSSSRHTGDITKLVHANSNDFFQEDLGMLWNVFAFGNPSSPDYPMKTPAMNLSPFCFPLIFVTCLARPRKVVWIFGVVLLVFAAMSASPLIHMLAIKYAGLGFAEARPLGGLYVPAFVVCAFGVDALLADRDRTGTKAFWPLFIVIGWTVVGVVAVLVPHDLESIDFGFFGLGLVLAGAAAAFVVWRSPWFLYGASLFSVAVFSNPALLHRPMSELATSSQLIERVKAVTKDEYRFAKFGRARTFLPSNEEVLVDLNSIHTYDSLSSARYGRLAARLSNSGVRAYGRHFDYLDSPKILLARDLSLAGVTCIVSDRELPLEGWDPIPVDSQTVLMVAREKPQLIAHLRKDEIAIEGAFELLDQSLAGTVEVVRQRDNELEVALQPSSKETLLFVSTQFHPDWVATTNRGRLKVVPIADFFLGIELPPDTTDVTLRFLPHSRWAWAPLVIFAVAFSSAGVWRFLSLISRSSADQSKITQQ